MTWDFTPDWESADLEAIESDFEGELGDEFV